MGLPEPGGPGRGGGEEKVVGVGKSGLYYSLVPAMYHQECHHRRGEEGEDDSRILLLQVIVLFSTITCSNTRYNVTCGLCYTLLTLCYTLNVTGVKKLT